MTDKIYEALNTDPLSNAEKITGKSYKEDEATSGLGFLMHMELAERKKKLLSESNDTYYGIPFHDAVAIFYDLGFRLVGSFPFIGESPSKGESRYEEDQYIMWHPDGFLADLESYRGDGLNSAKLYYNVEFPTSANWEYTSSGHYLRDEVDTWTWIGDHDAREGVRNTIERLRSAGKILPAWKERPWLWLLNYMDTKDDGYDYRAINEQRIAALPTEVRVMIGPDLTD